jgi:hypothetical protein
MDQPGGRFCDGAASAASAAQGLLSKRWGKIAAGCSTVTFRATRLAIGGRVEPGVYAWIAEVPDPGARGMLRTFTVR